MTEKKTLLNLSEDSARIEREIIENGGELTPELNAELESVGTALAEKIDSYYWRIKQLEAKAEFFKERAKEFSAVATSMNKYVKTMNERIKISMLNLGEKELKGDKFKFCISATKAALVVDVALLPDRFKIISYSADGDRIRNCIESGEEVPGARLEQNWRLDKRVNSEN